MLTTLYSFAGATINPAGSYANADGEDPNASLILGNDGNFYGTTGYGGPNGSGTIFQITPAGVLTSLYAFSAPSSQEPFGNADGVLPSGGLTLGSDGNFYGATTSGGTSGAGTIFKLAVISHPAFFTGQSALGNGVYHLTFPDGNYFGYYSYLADRAYIYHFDLGYEYVFDAADGNERSLPLRLRQQQLLLHELRTFPFPYLYRLRLELGLVLLSRHDQPGALHDEPAFFLRLRHGRDHLEMKNPPCITSGMFWQRNSGFARVLALLTLAWLTPVPVSRGQPAVKLDHAVRRPGQL